MTMETKKNNVETEATESVSNVESKGRARGREDKGRKKRVPFGSPAPRLPRGDDDRFVWRVFNDNWRREPGRIQRAKDAGYEVVGGCDEVAVGVNEDGSAIKGVLMRIPKELYDEDQKLKQKEIDKVNEQINRGSFQEKPEDLRYVPKDGIRIESKVTP